jgi:hypothetical protein
MGGVYFVGSPADASNMGFKLERSFTVQPGLRNFYFLSQPLFNGLSDIADSDVTGNKCTGTGDVDGGATPAGMVNADDLICDLWTSRDQSGGGAGFAVQKYDTTTCLFTARTAIKSGPTSYTFIGAFTQDLTTGINREIGYLINVTKGPADPLLENRAVIVGSHDPSFLGHTVSSSVCLQDILNVPYHTMYRTANELLCGLEGPDWQDANADGRPDTCPAGVFDPAGAAGVGATVQTFDNDPASGTAGLYQARTAVSLGAGNLNFLGPNFALKPGEAYLVNRPRAAADRTFLSPHF